MNLHFHSDQHKLQVSQVCGASSGRLYDNVSCCYESGSHSLKLHITHGLHFPSCTALTHSRPPLHQSHSCHHSLINSDCLTTPAPHSLTHIKAAHKHSLTAKSCFPLVTFLSVLPFILLSLCLTPDCPTLEL